MIVLKPFKSTLRRFKAGDHVSETDDLSPHSFAGLMVRKFIGAPKAPKLKKPAKAG
ncbi:hypothetical protein [Borborobacter arsenicus]|uniref:hypothetical protein n=1 Tax=Borborobacter arsenicus TaxID=1851146 RepID=UPI00140528CC|nr:hypothetical protein [Pseudaminobacter arsenicus]